MAISWLEATFPNLVHQAPEGLGPSILRAHPYALFDASVAIQGPLRKVCQRDNDNLAIHGARHEGHAVSFLYNNGSRDCILVIAWSGGQLQIDALADEIQPIWNVSCPPHLRVDSRDHVLGLAMICESIPDNHSSMKLDQPFEHTVWLGYPPPLLRLAAVDLALPKNLECGSLITLFADPLMPERIFALHDGGVDSIVLHFLPFTNQMRGKDETMRTPSVHPILSTCQGESVSPSPLLRFVSLADSFGYSWIVGVTISQECFVLEMKSWDLLLPINVEIDNEAIHLEEPKERDVPNIISKELLAGPKTFLVPQICPNLRSLTADSIEGRSALHHSFKLFHENYVYAYKVYFELKHHAPHLKRIVDDLQTHLNEAHQKLSKVEHKQAKLDERMDRASQRHNSLEERLNRLRNLPEVHKKPLQSRARV